MAQARNRLEYHLSVEDIAKEYGYSAEHVRMLARKHRIPAAKVGGVYRFNGDQVYNALVTVITAPDAVVPDASLHYERQPKAGEPTHDIPAPIDFDDIDFGV